jgi:Arc/MetJ family transcription regulator
MTTSRVIAQADQPPEAAMGKKLIDLDEEKLAAATKILDTETETETVNIALGEVVARARRAQALAELVEVARTGQFDELLDKEAW